MKSPIPVPYRISCRDCKHPGKYHGISGCILKDCNCKRLEAEELEHELCIDANTGNQICVQCSTDKDLDKGLCKVCREEEKKKIVKST